MSRLLFIGESWQGSCARALCGALNDIETAHVSDLAEDRFIPHARHTATRLANRLVRPLHRWEFRSAVRQSIKVVRPDAVVVYKGGAFDASLIAEIQRRGIPVVNVFPDYSPHAYGRIVQEAMGRYNLVVSTKPFHPSAWQAVYGYDNACVFVPHGYDPRVHLWASPASTFLYDLSFCGTWRREYERLAVDLGDALNDSTLAVAIAGAGWESRRLQLPPHWHVFGPRTGRAYGEFLRQAKIVVAPVNRDVVIRGVRQPGDEDTTRTYELAAMYCFFLHQRTQFISSVYDEDREVPLWQDARELAHQIRRWLPDDAGRRAFAANAHARAVPAYSIQQRANAILGFVERTIEASGSRVENRSTER